MDHTFVEFNSLSKDRAPMAREVVLRALWNAAGEGKSNAPSPEELERHTRSGEMITMLGGRQIDVTFTVEFPILDVRGYDACYGEGAGKAVLDDLLEKPVAKQLELREFLKRPYNREKARRTRERNRKRKLEGKEPFLDSRVRRTNRKYRYTGKHIGKRGKAPRQFVGKHRKLMDEARKDRIKEGKWMPSG